jgi:wyosine [tRNA(Phe)-imidazoG37] synthetase (radical SAM superfamily)
MPPLALLQLEVVRGPSKLPGIGQALEILPTSDTGREGVYPGQAIIVTTSARRLIEMSKAAEKLEAVVVTGAIEPTLHRDFREISENLKELGKKWYPKVPLILLTTPLHFENSDARHACSVFDRLIVRLDAGTQKSFAQMHGSKVKSIKDAIDQLALVEHPRLVVQTCLSQGEFDNTSEAEQRAWLGFLTRLHPMQVQLALPTKGHKGRKAPPKSKLDEIAAKVTEKVGAPVQWIGEI